MVLNILLLKILGFFTGLKVIGESKEKIFYIDNLTKKFTQFEKEEKNDSSFSEIKTDCLFEEEDLRLLTTNTSISHLVSVSSLNPYKLKTYFIEISTGIFKIFLISGKEVVSSSSGYDGEFFYLVVNNLNVYNIPTIHVFHILDSNVERTVIIEIPDFTFISSVFSFHDYLLVFVKHKIIVMKKESPSRFTVSHFCDLPFYGQKVDFTTPFGTLWVGMVSKKDGFIVSDVYEILKK